MDLGARSGCHSNVTEINAFFNFFIYFLTISVISLVSFRSFRFVVSGFSTCFSEKVDHNADDYRKEAEDVF